MPKQIAVIVADVHYDLTNLELADNCVRQAINKANELNLPLIVAGDLHNTKANLRGECVARIITTFKLAPKQTYVLVANHDRINEKSSQHSLTFLDHLVFLVNAPISIKITPEKLVYLLPYYHDPEELRTYLKSIPKDSTIIMHQGLNSSDSGDYIQDHSAINKEDVADFRVISGHYHKRQDIKTGRPRRGGVGLFSYVGNPYTLTFGEAKDPVKGFRILNDDGTLDFVPTNLRKHVIIESDASEKGLMQSIKTQVYPEDLLMVRIKDTKENLAKVNDKLIRTCTGIPSTVNYRLDLVQTDSEAVYATELQNLNQSELIDHIIEAKNTFSDHKKQALKKLWKSL